MDAIDAGAPRTPVADQSRATAGSACSAAAGLPAGSAVTEQPATATTSPTICAGSAGTPAAPVADQPRSTPGPAGHSGGRARTARPAVAIQQSAGPAGLPGAAVRAVADQRAAPQRLGGRIERTQRALLNSLQWRSVRGLRGQIRPRPRIQRPHKLLMKRAGLQANCVKLLTVPGKVRRHRRRYLVGAGSHQPSGRHCRRRCAPHSAPNRYLTRSAAADCNKSGTTVRSDTPPSFASTSDAVGIQRNQPRVLAGRKYLRVRDGKVRHTRRTRH